MCVCAHVGGGAQMRGNGCSVIQKTMLHVVTTDFTNTYLHM